MRRLLPVAAASLLLAACTDDGIGPTDPMRDAPIVLMSHVGGAPADDLCGGLSPCDAFFDYGDLDGDGVPDTGTPGFCFLPPMVDNHLSHPACSDAFVPGLDGIFELAWCQVDYGGGDGSAPPTLIQCDPGRQPLVQDPGGGEFYATSVRWRRRDPVLANGNVFRLYVVRGDQHFAHRDVIVDPNLTTPADDYVHAIGHGTEPVKVRITEGFDCILYDTQVSETDNAATCLIDGATSLTFDQTTFVTTFNFPPDNPTFLADFEVSECDSLTEPLSGNALVDVPLADCKISLDSELASLPNPAEIEITVEDLRWRDGPFGNARLNVLQFDEQGVAALAPSARPSPNNWLASATSSSAALRWIDWGFDKLASVFLPEPVYAFPRGSFDFSRMSDFQLALMPVMDHDGVGSECSVPEPHCRDLGTFPGTDPVPVSVHVTAPPRDSDAGGAFDVPYTRLHFFPSDDSSVECLDPLPYGMECSDSNPSDWGEVVVLTGDVGAGTGIGTVNWNLGDGESTLEVSACGVARPGPHEPNPPGEPGADGVWGTLTELQCFDRNAARQAPDAEAFDNGPADGHTPFEPAYRGSDLDDFHYEVALYGRPLTFHARTCPEIHIDGFKGDGGGGNHPGPEWDACATPTSFRAPLQGSKKGPDNAVLYTYNDGEALYIALEVETNDLGNKIFINLVEDFEGVDFVGRDGDDLLVIDFGDESEQNDWHFTLACEGNNSSSLCGDPDTVVDDPGGLHLQAAAMQNGAGNGRVFYEFRRPFGSPYDGTGALPKEDLGATPGLDVGLRLRVTQGQGGGKGGFVFPDPQTSPVVYHPFTLH